jgi:hypothetical protein
LQCQCLLMFSSFMSGMCMMMMSSLTSIWFFFLSFLSHIPRFSCCPWKKQNNPWTSFLFKFNRYFICFIWENHFKLTSFLNSILLKFFIL